MDSFILLGIVANTVAVVFGVLVVRSAYRAHNRTETARLRWLAAGFGFVTLGALVGGLALVVPHAGIEHGMVGQSALLAVGIGLVARSLAGSSSSDRLGTVRITE